MLGWVAIFSVVRGTGAAAGAVVAAAWTGGGAAAAVVLSPAAALAPPGRAAGAPPPAQAASNRATAASGPVELGRASMGSSSLDPLRLVHGEAPATCSSSALACSTQ